MQFQAGSMDKVDHVTFYDENWSGKFFEDCLMTRQIIHHDPDLTLQELKTGVAVIGCGSVSINHGPLGRVEWHFGADKVMRKTSCLTYTHRGIYSR